MTGLALRQLYLVSDDPESTAAFLEGAFALPVQFRDGGRWIQYDLGPVSFAVAAAEEGGGAPEGRFVPVLQTDDLDGLVETAIAAGATVAQTRDMGSHGRMVTLEVPGGALIAALQK